MEDVGWERHLQEYCWLSGAWPHHVNDAGEPQVPLRCSTALELQV